MIRNIRPKLGGRGCPPIILFIISLILFSWKIASGEITIRLKNGSEITGEIISIDSSKIIIQTQDIRLSVDIKNVDTRSSLTEENLWQRAMLAEENRNFVDMVEWFKI